MFTEALHTKLYICMQNEQKKSNLTKGNFDFHFQIGDMPPRVSCLYREAMRFAMFSAHALRGT